MDDLESETAPVKKTKPEDKKTNGKQAAPAGGLLAAIEELGDAKKVNPPAPKAEVAKAAPKASAAKATGSGLVALLDCAYEKNATAMAGVMTLADALREAGASFDDAPKKLGEWLSSNEITGVIVCDTHTPLGCECSDVLRLHAGVVIRGTR